MIKVKKYDDNLKYEMVTLSNNEKSFNIFYIDNSDLFWSCDIDDKYDAYSVLITKTDNYIYQLFEELYDSIISCEPFKHIKYDFKNKDLFFPHDIEDYRCLVKNDIIEWHSDDTIYDLSSVFFIEKKDDCYLVTFKKSKINISEIFPFSPFTVTISNSNSRYAPYNIAFMDMFNKLRDYDFYNNKIHISDYTKNRNKRIRKR